MPHLLSAFQQYGSMEYADGACIQLLLACPPLALAPAAYYSRCQAISSRKTTVTRFKNLLHHFRRNAWLEIGGGRCGRLLGFVVRTFETARSTFRNW
jgi:hypothetical protein